MNTLPRPIDLGDALTPVDVWQSLHAGEQSWIARAVDKPTFLFSEQIDGSDRMLMERLRAFPAERWIALCNGVGWTGLGAAALSWCEGAKLTEVLALFEALGVEPQPGSVEERNASFINPALLPVNRLSALLDAAERKISLLVLIATRKEAPEHDIPEAAADFVPEIAAMLASRSQQLT